MGALPDSPFRLQHEMFVLDAYLESPLPTEGREPAARKYVAALLQALGMQELSPLQFCDAADLRAPGWSFIQPITTSHIAAHYFEAPGRLPNIRLDVYSCKSVDWRTIIAVSAQNMPLEQWQATFIHRGFGDERIVQDIRGKGTIVTSIDTVQEERRMPTSTPATPVHTA